MSSTGSLKKDDLLLVNKYGVLPDPDFNATRNKSIIDKSIEKYELARAEKIKLWNEQMRDRADATAMFLKHVDKGKHNDIVKYFGRQELARLRGEDIATQLKSSLFKNGS